MLVYTETLKWARVIKDAPDKDGMMVETLKDLHYRLAKYADIREIYCEDEESREERIERMTK